MSEIREVFTDIYQNRKWDPQGVVLDSVSGPGSTIQYTSNLRAELPRLFDTFGITRVFDAPCGDLNWMSHVLDQCPDIEYIGGDIVPDLIRSNIEKFGQRPRTQFVEIDIIHDALPDAEIMICRECLFHFSNADINSFFQNFVKSNIASLLITCDLVPDEANFDITTGEFRHVNFFIDPWNFSRDYIYQINDWPYSTPACRQMYMWSQDQIANFIK